MTDTVPPKDRDTDPEIHLSDHEILLALKQQVAQMEEDISAIKKEVAGTARAFHDVNKHLAGIRADIDLASEQLVPWNTMLGELHERLVKFEVAARKSTIPPPGEA